MSGSPIAPTALRSGIPSPDGRRVWWFDDSDGDGLGRWMRQPFDGPGPAHVAVPDLPPGYQCGIALGRQVAVIGWSTSDGARVVVQREGRPTVPARA